MHETFTAVDAATDLRAHARALRRQWEATFGGAHTRARVRPVIARSWSRLAGAGLDPSVLRPRPAFGVDDLDAARAASPLRGALPALRHHLRTIADDAEHVMVVCDAAGRILWLEGHPRVLETARGITFTAGMTWTETGAGTNAIGTALAIDHAVQIFSAEHFLPEQHSWWCSAAPIHDPVTGEVLGVVDISGPLRTAHPYSLALVDAAARIAEGELRSRQPTRDDDHAHLEGTWHARTGANMLVDARGRALGGRTIDLRLLGRYHHEVRIDGGDPVVLTLRQAEALALLAMHPDGLSAEQMTLHLYGDDGKAVTTRALMSRLRGVLGSGLRARPYQLCGDVRADFLEVLALVHAGDVAGALARYRGPLLVESQVLRIEDTRRELAGALRRLVMVNGPDAVWAWLQTDDGREDRAAMERFVDRGHPADPRRGAVEVRLRALDHLWN